MHSCFRRAVEQEQYWYHAIHHSYRERRHLHIPLRVDSVRTAVTTQMFIRFGPQLLEQPKLLEIITPQPDPR